MCDQQTTELCDKLQSIAIEAETNSDFDVWVGYVSSQLLNKAAITEARPSFTLSEMYDYDISPGIAAFILEDNHRQRIAHEAALARIRELESATIAAALALPEAERYRLWVELGKKFAPVYPKSNWPADHPATGTYYGIITASTDANYAQWLNTTVALLLHQESLGSYDANMLMRLYKRGLSPSETAALADLARSTGKYIE